MNEQKNKEELLENEIQKKYGLKRNKPKKEKFDFFESIKYYIITIIIAVIYIYFLSEYHHRSPWKDFIYFTQESFKAILIPMIISAVLYWFIFPTRYYRITAKNFGKLLSIITLICCIWNGFHVMELLGDLFKLFYQAFIQVQ